MMQHATSALGNGKSSGISGISFPMQFQGMNPAFQACHSFSLMPRGRCTQGPCLARHARHISSADNPSVAPRPRWQWSQFYRPHHRTVAHAASAAEPVNHQLLWESHGHGRAPLTKRLWKSYPAIHARRHCAVTAACVIHCYTRAEGIEFSVRWFGQVVINHPIRAGRSSRAQLISHRLPSVSPPFNTRPEPWIAGKEPAKTDKAGDYSTLAICTYEEAAGTIPTSLVLTPSTRTSNAIQGP